jgi:ElaB/YqjD/DUF883 family membrane-anchored ribosome-binding protein
MSTLREARIRRDLNNVASQVDSLLSKLGDEGSDRLHDLRDRVSSVASDFTSSARDRLAAMDVRGNARHAAHVTTEYVRENPWRVIGIGAAAGLLLGYLATRRRY